MKITVAKIDQWLNAGVPAVEIVRRVCWFGGLTEDQIVAWLDIVVTRIARSHSLPWSLHLAEEYSPRANRSPQGEDSSVEHVLVMVVSKSVRASRAAWAAEREQQVLDLLGVLLSEEAGR